METARCGTLGRCATLGPLDLSVIRSTPISAAYDVVVREVLERLDDPDIRAATTRALRLGRLYRLADRPADVVRRRRLRARLKEMETTIT